MKEKKVKIEFDTYGSPIEPKEKKECFFKNIWNRTVFPDMIRARKEEKLWKLELQREAKEELRDELKEEYKKIYKKAELDKLKGKKSGKGKNMLNKLADEFKGMGDAVGNKDIAGMMGMGSGGNGNKDVVGMMGTGRNNDSSEKGLTNEDIENILSLNGREVKVKYVGNKKKKKKKKKSKSKESVQVESYEDKIKRMLS